VDHFLAVAQRRALEGLNGRRLGGLGAGAALEFQFAQLAQIGLADLAGLGLTRRRAAALGQGRRRDQRQADRGGEG
jgi:hypothetical protein